MTNQNQPTPLVGISLVKHCLFISVRKIARKRQNRKSKPDRRWIESNTVLRNIIQSVWCNDTDERNFKTCEREKRENYTDIRFRRKLLQIRCSCNRAPRHLQLKKKGRKQQQKKKISPEKWAHSSFCRAHSSSGEINVFYSVFLSLLDAIRIEQKIISAFVIMKSFLFCQHFASALCTAMGRCSITAK